MFAFSGAIDEIRTGNPVMLYLKFKRKNFLAFAVAFQQAKGNP